MRKYTITCSKKRQNNSTLANYDTQMFTKLGNTEPNVANSSLTKSNKWPILLHTIETFMNHFNISINNLLDFL